MAHSRGPRKPDHASTRIISHRKVMVDGVEFRWWAVGERPALVTVRASVFGSLAEFTDQDCSVFARALAKKLLARHYQRATRGKTAGASPTPMPALKKAGWFEAEQTSTSSTATTKELAPRAPRRPR